MTSAAALPRELAALAGMFNAGTRIFEKTVQGIPDEKWFVQAGNDSNHLLWIAGHVVVHRAKVLRIGGVEWSAPWEQLFPRGSQRVPAEQYPQPVEILDAWKEVSAKLPLALDRMTPELLSK